VTAMTHEEFVSAHKSRRLRVKVRGGRAFLRRADLPAEMRERVTARCRRRVIALSLWAVALALVAAWGLLVLDRAVWEVAIVVAAVGALFFVGTTGEVIRDLAIEDERFYRLAVESGVLEAWRRGK